MWTPALFGSDSANEAANLTETLALTQSGTALLSHLIENNGALNPMVSRIKKCTKVPGSPKGHSRSRSVGQPAESRDEIHLHPAFAKPAEERVFESFNSPLPPYGTEFDKPAAKRRTKNPFRLACKAPKMPGHERSRSTQLPQFDESHQDPPAMLSEISFGTAPILFRSELASPARGKGNGPSPFEHIIISPRKISTESLEPKAAPPERLITPMSPRFRPMANSHSVSTKEYLESEESPSKKAQVPVSRVKSSSTNATQVSRIPPRPIAPNAAPPRPL